MNSGKTINQDRFYAGVGSDGLVHWWCRSGGHEFTEKALRASLPALDDSLDDPDFKNFKGRTHEELLSVPTAKDFMGCKYTLSDVDKYWSSAPERVAKYWGQWGLDQEAIDTYRLGYMHFCIEDGQPYAGYTIPHFWHSGDGEVLVKGIHARRDDQIPGNAMQRKYSSLSTSKISGIFWDKAVCLPDETRIGSAIDFVFLSEDERTAMCLNTLFRQLGVDCSMAAIGYHKEKSWDRFLARALSNATFKFVLQDNDEQIDENGIRNFPGLDYALHVQSAAGRNTAILMHPIYKQLSDMAYVEGLGSIWPWLQEQITEKVGA